MNSFCLKKSPNYSKDGFTIIELIMVVLVVGLLSGALINVIDVGRQRDYASDGVLRQNLSDISGAIETYRVAEGSYPDKGAGQNPRTGSDSGVVNQYLDDWPSGFTYFEDGSDFIIYVESATNAGQYFKYSSDWQAIKECGSTDIGTISGCEAL